MASIGWSKQQWLSSEVLWCLGSSQGQGEMIQKNFKMVFDVFALHRRVNSHSCGKLVIDSCFELYGIVISIALLCFLSLPTGTCSVVRLVQIWPFLPGHVWMYESWWSLWPAKDKDKKIDPRCPAGTHGLSGVHFGYLIRFEAIKTSCASIHVGRLLFCGIFSG